MLHARHKLVSNHTINQHLASNKFEKKNIDPFFTLNSSKTDPLRSSRVDHQLESPQSIQYRRGWVVELLFQVRKHVVTFYNIFYIKGLQKQAEARFISPATCQEFFTLFFQWKAPVYTLGYWSWNTLEKFTVSQIGAAGMVSGWVSQKSKAVGSY